MYFIKLATLSSHSHHSHRLYTHGQCPRPSKHSGPARPKGTPHAKGVFHLVSREMPQRVGQLATCCFPKQHAVCTGVLVQATWERDLRLTAVTRQNPCNMMVLCFTGIYHTDSLLRPLIISHLHEKPEAQRD